MVDTAARAEDRTILELLESRSDADIAALDVDRKTGDMELLFDALLEQGRQYRTAEVHLREARHHHQLACRHEDSDEIYWTNVQIEHFQQWVPVYQDRWRRLYGQWQRYWDALLHHRLPDELYEALLAIAEAEGRTLTEQMVVFLDEAVARWQGPGARL